MITLLATLASALINLLPMVLKLFESWMNIRKEIKLRELEIDLAKQNLQTQKDIADIYANLREGESLRSHDAALTSDGFVNALRASVRPIITYVFFALFLIIKAIGIYHVVHLGGIPIGQALPLLWDEPTQAIFGSILGFWFGSRAQEMYKFKK